MSRLKNQDFEWYDEGEAKPRPQSALIVEDDTDIAELTKRNIEGWRPFRVDTTNDGSTGWKLIEEVAYDLIILDWRLPKLSGMVILNRLRTRPEYEITPVLVYSGLLEPADFRLLEEFPCTCFVAKPRTGAVFIASAEKLLTDYAWFAENWALVNDAIALLRVDKAKGIARLLAAIEKNRRSIPVIIRSARALAGAEEFQTAKQILIDLLKTDPGSILALYELGKMLYRTKEFAAAARTLGKAQDLSPKNINRARLMGEVALNAGDPGAAERHFGNALAMDRHDASAKAGLDLAIDLHREFQPERGQLENSLASILNLMGVNLVRQGAVDQAINKYESAIEFLADPLDKGKILFNIGLAFSRTGKNAEAMNAFSRANQISGGRLPKAIQYIERANGYQQVNLSNEVLDLATASQDHPTPSRQSAVASQPSPSGIAHLKSTQPSFQIPLPVDIPETNEILQLLDDAAKKRETEDQRLSESPTEMGRLRIAICHPNQLVCNRLVQQFQALHVGSIMSFSTWDEFYSALNFYRPSVSLVWLEEKTELQSLTFIEEIIDLNIESAVPVIVYADSEILKAKVAKNNPPIEPEVCRIVNWNRNAFAADIRAATQGSKTSIQARIAAVRQELAHNHGDQQLRDIEATVNQGAASPDAHAKYRWSCIHLEFLLGQNRLEEAEKSARPLIKHWPLGFRAQLLFGETAFRIGNLAGMMEAASNLSVHSRLNSRRALEMGLRLPQLDGAEALKKFLQAWTEEWSLPVDQNFHELAASYFMLEKDYERVVKSLGNNFQRGFVTEHSLNTYRAAVAKLSDSCSHPSIKRLKTAA